MSIFQSNGLSWKAIIVGVIASMMGMLIIMCLIAGVLLFASAIPYEILPYLMLVADAVGVFFGSYLAAALAGSKGLITGLCSGAITFLIMLIIGFGNNAQSVTILTILHLMVFLIFGILGGIKGVNRKERVHIR